MKISILTLGLVVALSFASRAEDANTKISGVHLCCKGCVTGVEKAVSTVPGAKADVDKDAGTVTLSGPDKATVQKASAALTKAGYFGTSSDTGIKVSTKTGAKNEKVQTLKIDGVHLCCTKCVKAVDTALKSVDGVKGNTAEKGAKSFDVTGNFNDQEVFAALQKEGLTGKVGK